MDKSTEKKRFIIFLVIAYGMTAIMSVFMWIGLRHGRDLTAFVNVQMFYPACGVILGKLLAGREEEKLPLSGYIVFLVMTAVMMLIAIVSAFLPDFLPELLELGISGWNLASQGVILFGSLVVYVLFWVCGREKRVSAGIARRNLKKSILVLIVFIALYLLRYVVSLSLTDLFYQTGGENVREFVKILKTPLTWLMGLSLVFNFFFVFTAFFGEEYGWRYYLQPLMQKRFGRRGGVLLLGLAWAVWHLNVNFMFYTTTTGPQMFVGQVITCVSMGIFFAYAYMKTQNIWVPVIMHFLNNNLLVVFAGGDASVLQNQVINWMDIPIMLLESLVFALFILAPVFGGERAEEVPADRV